ncbi:MAG: tetratricopeptide repeat protein [Anaerolineae bacterium]|nr:tetratricopeptide repeat protein [Anaerolineae bacterium]
MELERLSNLKVPATLTGLLQARLDGLKADVRETLQQASVVGRIFWTDIVEHMHNPDLRSAEMTLPITDRFGVLRNKELIYRYEESASKQASEFIFKNQILHDVTYESVLLRLRPVYHVQAAVGLVEIGGERANEYAGRVGEHYERAGEWLKAAEWYARAGRQAQNTYASDSAIGFYQKALGFINGHGTDEHRPLKIDVLQRLGDVLNWQARYTEAMEVHGQMAETAQEADDSAARSRALQALATSVSYQGDHRAALEYALQAETLARTVDAKLELFRALYTQGWARFRLGEGTMALSLAQKALEVSTDLKDPNEMARCLNLLGAAYYASGQYDMVEKYWEEALKIFRELGNQQQGMDLLSNLGVVADARGDYETAFQRYDGALSIAREIGYRDGEIVFLTNRGGELVALNNHAAAEADLRQAIQMAGVTGSWCMPLTFNFRAEALIGLGKYDEAFYSARQALVLAEEDKTPEYIGMAWRTLGVICDRTDDMVRFSDWETHQMGEYNAEDCFGRSAKIFADADLEMERARTLRDWARHEFGRGGNKRATDMWREAQEIFEKIGAHMEVERMGELPE